MAVPLRCVVGQFSVVDSIRYPEAENVLVVEPGSFPGSTRDDFGLCALVELSGLVLPPPDLQQSLPDILLSCDRFSCGIVAAGVCTGVSPLRQENERIALPGRREFVLSNHRHSCVIRLVE